MKWGKGGRAPNANRRFSFIRIIYFIKIGSGHQLLKGGEIGGPLKGRGS